jgi:hypothetical protein
VSGVSTRSVDGLVESMGAASGISMSEVSRICAGLDERVAAFGNRTLGHVEFPYVHLDAIYVHVRDGALGQVVSRAIVVATGVIAQDQREVLGVDVGDSEAETSGGNLCPQSISLRSTAQLSAEGRGSPVTRLVPYADVASLRAAAPTATLATVVRAGEPLVVTPTRLPRQYLDETGAFEPGVLSWAATTATLSVEKALWGEDPGSQIATFDLGCLAPGATPLTTVGQQLVLFSEPSVAEYGPDSAIGATHRVVEYAWLDSDGYLRPRPMLIGTPSTIPLLLNVSLDEALAMLDSK